MATWQGFLREARRFWEVARSAAGFGYANQAVSNAAHAATAASDALCLFLIRERPQGRSHVEAARMLTRACKATEWERDVAQHAQQLVAILQQKSASEYHGRVLDADAADRVMKQAERFLAWAEEVLPNLDAAHLDVADPESGPPA